LKGLRHVHVPGRPTRRKRRKPLGIVLKRKKKRKSGDSRGQNWLSAQERRKGKGLFGVGAKGGRRGVDYSEKGTIFTPYGKMEGEDLDY